MDAWTVVVCARCEMRIMNHSAPVQSILVLSMVPWTRPWTSVPRRHKLTLHAHAVLEPRDLAMR